jgi:hypothetical protein
MTYDRIGVLRHQLQAGCAHRNERWLPETIEELTRHIGLGYYADDPRAEELLTLLRTI